MNLNIYIEDKLNHALVDLAKVEGKSRNALIREAIALLLEKHRSAQWPSSIKHFKGDPSFTPFETHRKALKPPKEDPFS